MSNSPNGTPASVPFLYDGDGYAIHVRVADRHIYIDSVDVYPNNLNVDPTNESFMDLTPLARRAVIDHLNRKYPGKTIHV